MKFKIYSEYGALNSKPVLDSFRTGLIAAGHEIVNSNEDIPVIWSILWNGRMKPNEAIYKSARAQGKNVLIAEVGSLIRGETWKVCLNNINGRGLFPNTGDLDLDRPKKLGIYLRDRKNYKKEILITTQHDKSLQWEGQLSLDKWVEETIIKIKKFTDIPIVVRQHPRCPLRTKIPGIKYEVPIKLPNTYDNFDIDYGYHCVINYNSGPSVQAPIAGTPIICDESSLGYNISEKIENINELTLPDRSDWFLKICHTEWTIEEICSGLPFKLLFKN
jgi:hypothetical protein